MTQEAVGSACQRLPCVMKFLLQTQAREAIIQSSSPSTFGNLMNTEDPFAESKHIHMKPLHLELSSPAL